MNRQIGLSKAQECRLKTYADDNDMDYTYMIERIGFIHSLCRLTYWDILCEMEV